MLSDGDYLAPFGRFAELDAPDKPVPGLVALRMPLRYVPLGPQPYTFVVEPHQHSPTRGGGGRGLHGA